MGNEGLKIVIGADIGSAIAGVSKLTDAMQGVSSSANDAAGALNKIPAALRPVDPAKMKAMQDAVAKLKQDIATFPKNPIPDPFKNIPKGANQAATALTNVGRVAQDLPFGFVGIQNNLNPLLESFQRLKAETGSGKAALAALGQSLIGPAGIGIALSVVSAAILIFQNGIAGFNSKTKEAKDKTEEFLKTLKSVGDVAGAAGGSQAGDIAQVQALANVITNSNNAYSQRKRALEELKEVNKNYFGDLKLEEGLMDKLKDRVNEYTKAIVAQAVVKGFSDEIGRVSVELSKQDRALKKSTDEVNRLRTALANTKQSETSLTGEDRISSKYIKAKNALDDANDAFTTQFGVVGKLRSNLDELNVSIDEAVKESLKFRDLTGPGGNKSNEDSLKKQLDLLEKIRDAAKEFQGQLFNLKDIDAATDKLAALEQQVGNLKLQIAVRDAKKAGLPAAEIERLKDAIKQDTQKRLNEAFEKETLLLEFSTKLKFSQVIRAEIPGNIDSQIAKATGLDKKIPEITIPEVRLKFQRAGLKFRIPAEILNALDEMNVKLREQIKGIFEGGLTDVFTGLGEGIGESFSESLTGEGFGEGLKKAAQNILGIVGSVMQQLGKALIVAAIKIKLLKETFEKWAIANPALAIVAGIGLVAAGAALKNIKFDGPKFADGGIVSGPMIGQVGERFRPEVIIPLDRLPQLFKQFGGDGGGGTQLIPIINNEGLYLAMKRGERSAGRKF
jgi:archaellum component FlaC